MGCACGHVPWGRSGGGWLPTRQRPLLLRVACVRAFACDSTSLCQERTSSAPSKRTRKRLVGGGLAAAVGPWALRCWRFPLVAWAALVPPCCVGCFTAGCGVSLLCAHRVTVWMDLTDDDQVPPLFGTMIVLKVSRLSFEEGSAAPALPAHAPVRAAAPAPKATPAARCAGCACACVYTCTHGSERVGVFATAARSVQPPVPLVFPSGSATTVRAPWVRACFVCAHVCAYVCVMWCVCVRRC
jgi:hypothetical protein